MDATHLNPKFGSPANSGINDDGKLDTFTTRSDKSLLKSTPFNNNTKPEYTSLQDESSPKTTLKGRKTIAFWTLVCLLFILAIGNLILTFIILGVLRLGSGMESLEVISEKSLLKFYKDTDLDRLYKRDGKLEGFTDKPVEITGENSPLLLNLADKNTRPENKFRLDRNGTMIKCMHKFEINEPGTGYKIFTTDNPKLHMNDSTSKLKAKIINTNRISSGIDENLYLKAGARAHLRGNEGTNMGSREIVWSADQDIYLKSDNGSVILNSKEGIFIDIKKIPIVAGTLLSKSIAQYKICVCMPPGKLFRIPIYSEHGPRISCSHISLGPHHNPCK